MIQLSVQIFITSTILQSRQCPNQAETDNKLKKTRKKIINKTSYFLSNSLNKSLNQKWKQKISPRKRRRKIRKLFYEKWIPFQTKQEQAWRCIWKERKVFSWWINLTVQANDRQNSKEERIIWPLNHSCGWYQRTVGFLCSCRNKAQAKWRLSFWTVKISLFLEVIWPWHGCWFVLTAHLWYQPGIDSSCPVG